MIVSVSHVDLHIGSANLLCSSDKVFRKKLPFLVEIVSSSLNGCTSAPTKRSDEQC